MNKYLYGFLSLLITLLISLSGCKANTPQTSSVPESVVSENVNTSIDKSASEKGESLINSETQIETEITIKNSSTTTVTQAHSEPSSEHTHLWKGETTPAKCRTGGYTIETCSCGKVRTTDITQPIGHNWSEWIVNQPASYISRGSEYRRCTRCGLREERDIEKLTLDPTEYQNEVFRLVNQERAKLNLSPLKYYSAAQNAAKIRVDEIKNSFSHTRPNGKTFSTVIDDAGISYSKIGENISYGYTIPSAVMDGWMNSSRHKANILNPDFTHIIIGYNGTHWVQLFLTI